MGIAILDWRRRYVAKLKQAAAERELEQAREAEGSTRRRLRRARLLAAAMALLLVAACALGVLAVSNARAAASARDMAWAQKLAESANDVVDARADTAILLGLQSLSRSPEHVPPEGLVSGLAQFTHPFTVLQEHGHTGAVNAVAFSSDGALLATAGADGTAQLWDRRFTS
jgi:hypothetical protein